MRRLVATSIGLTLGCSSSIANAQEPLHLTPASRWVLDYAEESCRLARSFGQGDEEITLIMSQFEPGDEFVVTLAGKSWLPSYSDGPLNIKLRFGPAEEQSEESAYTGTLGDKRAILFTGAQRLAPYTKAERIASRERYERGSFVAAPIGKAREAAVKWLTISFSQRKELVLETGPMNETMAKLRECSWDTVKHWGLDVEQQRTLSRVAFPTDSPANWISADDYPTRMLRGGYQGIVHFRLMVDAAGKATSCTIQLSTRPKEFDDAVCRNFMRRARFTPALDAQGKPVPSYWRSSVQFRLE